MHLKKKGFLLVSKATLGKTFERQGGEHIMGIPECFIQFLKLNCAQGHTYGYVTVKSGTFLRAGCWQQTLSIAVEKNVHRSYACATLYLCACSLVGNEAVIKAG